MLWILGIILTALVATVFIMQMRKKQVIAEENDYKFEPVVFKEKKGKKQTGKKKTGKKKTGKKQTGKKKRRKKSKGKETKKDLNLEGLQYKYESNEPRL